MENEASDQTKRELKKGQWTPEEDMLLKRYIETHGEGKWTTVSQRSGLMRAGKSCRMRWMNYLRPNLKHGAMSEDEEDLIIRMHKLLGNRWSLIAGRIPGRTDNEIKNYWHTHLGKRSHDHQADPDQTTTTTSNYSKKRKLMISTADDDDHETTRTTEIAYCNSVFNSNNNNNGNDQDDLCSSEILNGAYRYNFLQCKLLPGETAYYEEPFSPALNSLLLHSFGNTNYNCNTSSTAMESRAVETPLYLPDDIYSSVTLI